MIIAPFALEPVLSIKITTEAAGKELCMPFFLPALNGMGSIARGLRAGIAQNG